jgi:hypothetical protein
MNHQRSFSLKLITGFLIILPSILLAQLPKRVDGESIKNIITFLSSDDFKGRETGTKECIRAEDYISNEFKKLKLIPAGDKDSYFYNYTLRDRKEAEKPSLIIDGRF